MAASAGGIAALSTVLGALPAELRVPVVVVQHLDPRHETLLAGVLGRRTALTVKLAEDGELAQAGIVHVAPPDHHLLVGKDGILSLSMAERLRFLRPSADLLFESVASAYGDRALVVVLSGTGADGAAGVQAVEAQGGTVIVQDLISAEFNGMPRAAAETGVADFVLPLDEIGPVVHRLASSGETA
jgi:two-component system, chemotaxis family, protein-glutamate methylesterase/glutaminase